MNTAPEVKKATVSHMAPAALPEHFKLVGPFFRGIDPTGNRYHTIGLELVSTDPREPELFRAVGQALVGSEVQAIIAAGQETVAICPHVAKVRELIAEHARVKHDLAIVDIGLETKRDVRKKYVLNGLEEPAIRMAAEIDELARRKAYLEERLTFLKAEIAAEQVKATGRANAARQALHVELLAQANADAQALEDELMAFLRRQVPALVIARTRARQLSGPLTPLGVANLPEDCVLKEPRTPPASLATRFKGAGGPSTKAELPPEVQAMNRAQPDTSHPPHNKTDWTAIAGMRN